MTTTQADRLRIIADLIDAHPGLPTPTVFAYSHGKADVSWHLAHNTDLDQKATTQAIVRAIGGLWNKGGYDDRLTLTRDWRGIQLNIFVTREEVCTRRVVGTETVVVPAVEAQPERTEVRELVEWDCAPVLGDRVVAS